MIVFPGMTVPLHVFEERYKLLVRRAASADPARFVIARPGRVRRDDGAAPPSDVGTIVQIVERRDNEDGTIDVVVHGRERCRTERHRRDTVDDVTGRPTASWTAQVEPWPLERTDPNDERVAAWDALEAFDRYGSVFFAPEAREQAALAMPADLVYQASFVCANLRLPADEAEPLLLAPTLADRFRAATAAIAVRLERAEATR